MEKNQISDEELEKIKQKIIKLIDKIYEEEDEDKSYALIHKLAKMFNDKLNKKKIKKWFLHELGDGYCYKIKKIVNLTSEGKNDKRRKVLGR